MLSYFRSSAATLSEFCTKPAYDCWYRGCYIHVRYWCQTCVGLPGSLLVAGLRKSISFVLNLGLLVLGTLVYSGQSNVILKQLMFPLLADFLTMLLKGWRESWFYALVDISLMLWGFLWIIKYMDLMDVLALYSSFFIKYLWSTLSASSQLRKKNRTNE